MYIAYTLPARTNTIIYQNNNVNIYFIIQDIFMVMEWTRLYQVNRLKHNSHFLYVNSCENAAGKSTKRFTASECTAKLGKMSVRYFSNSQTFSGVHVRKQLSCHLFGHREYFSLSSSRS